MRHVSLRDISVRFGSLQALDHVSLELEPGRVTMLAGPNGSGKTTLMGVLLGLVRPRNGDMRIDGERRRPDQAFRAQLGYLPEAVAFAPNLSARQVLRFFAQARGARPGRVEEALERVRLSDSARRAVRGFSRGMLQRLGVATAILAEPDLLVLDEPTGGLDQAGLTVLSEIIDEWSSGGRFVLIASHDLVLMERRVHDIIMLSSGKVCASGSPVELRRRADLPVRVHFEISQSGPPVDAFVAELQRLDLPALHRNGRSVIAETRAEGLLALLETQGRGVVDSLRVEEPGFDAIYDAILAEET